MSPTLLFALPLLASCSLGLEPFAPPGGSGGGEGDVDVDADSDADVDSGWDSDGGSGGSGSGGSGSGSGSGGSGGSGGDGEPIDVTSISPAWGLSTGGDEATVSGGPFDSSTVISIGSTESTVVTRGTTSMVVKTPAYTRITAGEGKATVNVLAENDDGGEGRLDDGFTYYEDASKKAGLIGAIHWNHYVGSYWSGGGDYGSAELIFTTPPADIHYWNLYGDALDGCQDDSYNITDSYGDIYVYDQGVSSLTLVPASGTRTTLYLDAKTGTYANDADLATGQVPQGTRLDLDTVNGTFAPEAFSVTGFGKTASSFSVSTPNISGSSLQNFNQSSFNVSWSGGSSGDVVLIISYTTNSSGTVGDSVYCLARDDGSFQIPYSAWARAWTRGNYVYLLVGRAVESAGTLPYNNGETRFAGIYWNIGAGIAP